MWVLPWFSKNRRRPVKWYTWYSGRCEGPCGYPVDMAETWGTICHTADKLLNEGCPNLCYLDSWNLFWPSDFSINSISFVAVVITNPIPQEDKMNHRCKTQVISISMVFAEAIRRAHNGESASSLFSYVSILEWLLRLFKKSAPLLIFPWHLMTNSAKDPACFRVALHTRYNRVYPKLEKGRLRLLLGLPTCTVHSALLVIWWPSWL